MDDDIAHLFRRLTTGVYVIGVAHDDQRNAFTAAWVTQVSFRPLLLALSINPQHASYSLLTRGRVFAVSVLRAGQLEVARHFGMSGRSIDKLAGYAWRSGRTGSPILCNAAAYFDCQVAGDVEAGDHRLVLGRVVEGAVLDPEARPMTYAETGDLDGSADLYPAAF